MPQATAAPSGAVPEREKPSYARVVSDFEYTAHNLLASRVPPNSRVLDVGCGEGALSAYLQSRGNRVVCIENDAERMEIAKAKGLNVRGIDVRDGDIEGLGTFDVIICADVLEHTQDPTFVLGRLRQLLAPEGLLLVSLPNVAFVTVRLGLLLGRFNYENEGILDRTHLKFFTHRTSRDLLEQGGFKIIYEALALPSRVGPYEFLTPVWRRVMDSQVLGKAIYRTLGLRPGLTAFQFVYAARRAAPASAS